MAMLGIRSRTTTLDRERTAGVKTDCWGSAIANAESASRWQCGINRDPILKERLFGSVVPKGIMARTSRSCITTWTRRRLILT